MKKQNTGFLLTFTFLLCILRAFCAFLWLKMFNQKQQIMQNEPNFQKSQMFITSIKTMDYNEKPTMDTWSKRTQTNPNLPATPFGGQSQFLPAVASAKVGRL
jgi:hypothetical protein